MLFLYFSHVWQTVSAITAGLLVLSLFIIMLTCAVKKKNATRARVINRGMFQSIATINQLIPSLTEIANFIMEYFILSNVYIDKCCIK